MYLNKRGEHCGLIFNIQSYTIHDGPGIRTEVFFKGCPLRCPWCSNPEGIRPEAQLGIYPAKCLSLQKCGFCVSDCPAEEKPLRFDGDGILCGMEQADLCRDCLRCADACPAGAVIVWGKKMTGSELMERLEKDRAYFEKTGGGVTLSGGEVLLQWEFAAELLHACKESGIHTCVESALHVPTEYVDAILPYTDLFITDIKHMDPDTHKRLTGAGNELILKNIRHVAASGVPMVIRTPVVPGYNDAEENILAIGKFIREQLGDAVIQYQLLPYRKMGTEKYATLCQAYPMGDYVPPERSEWEPRLMQLRDLLIETCGIPAVAGSAEKLPLR